MVGCGLEVELPYWGVDDCDGDVGLNDGVLGPNDGELGPYDGKVWSSGVDGYGLELLGVVKGLG